jgi:hypothetical protein
LIIKEKRIMKTTRRNFLHAATTLAGGLLLTGTKNNHDGSAGIPELVRIDEPFNGAILNHRHGIQADGVLKIKVQGEAPLNSRITVNGVPAQTRGTRFVSEILLSHSENEIRAKAEGWFGQNEHSIRVVWDKNSFARYRFSIDDNIYFLRDITQKKYPSLFDCFYLKGLRDLNRKYGTKFVLNIYYTDGLEYTDRKEFTLTQFPDRYKSEWKDNAGWLRLAFHAWSNKPDRPYQYASAGKLISDLDKVAEQIHRFAGEETYTPPTVIHWGMIQPAALKPLAEKGVRVLSGFSRSGSGYDINYFLDDTRSEYIMRHDGLMDFDSGIIFSKVDMICNNTPVERIRSVLEPLAIDTDQAEVMDIFTHEEYFWPFYSVYIPDHFQRLDTAIRWLTEHGYKPVFFHEGLMGAPENAG